MAALSHLAAWRAIVDNQGKPLQDFMSMWQDVVDASRSSEAAQLALYGYAASAQVSNLAAYYSNGIALEKANELAATAGGTVRSGLDAQTAATSGATWTTVCAESLTTVSAGDLTFVNSGPVMAADAVGTSTGEWRIQETTSGTTVYTGSWTSQGDGVAWSLVTNHNLFDTLTQVIPLTSTGSVTYTLDVRVLDGEDVTLTCYLYVERS